MICLWTTHFTFTSTSSNDKLHWLEGGEPGWTLSSETTLSSISKLSQLFENSRDGDLLSGSVPLPVRAVLSVCIILAKTSLLLTMVRILRLQHVGPHKGARITRPPDSPSFDQTLVQREEWAVRCIMKFVEVPEKKPNISYNFPTTTEAWWDDLLNTLWDTRDARTE